MDNPELNLNSFNILILGLGKVGMTYDFSGPSQQVLTHARAINEWSTSKNINIRISAVDPNPDTKKPFNEIFKNGEWFSNIYEVKPETSFDLAVIATPIATIAHDTLRVCQDFKINRLVIEKPAAKSLEELNALISIPKSSSKCIVGFPRPLLPSSILLRDEIQSFGGNVPWKVDIYYGGSVLNILSHFLNLIEFVVESFKLDSFSFSTEGYLNAIFKSESERLIIHTHQYSEFNDEKNEMHIEGPITIAYTNSGRSINFSNLREKNNGTEIRKDFKNEVSQMIGNFGNRYLMWALLSEDSEFTRLTSPSLSETIRLAEAINVR